MDELFLVLVEAEHHAETIIARCTDPVTRRHAEEVRMMTSDLRRRAFADQPPTTEIVAAGLQGLGDFIEDAASRCNDPYFDSILRFSCESVRDFAALLCGTPVAAI
jgi:hypothetical protein